MGLQVWFWVLMAIWLLFGFWVGSIPQPDQQPYHRWGGSLLLFILFAILGWAVFGAPVK